MEHKIKRTMAFISTKNDGDKLLIADAIEWADKTMIDKACEILENITVTYNRRFFGKYEEKAFDADFIKKFRQTMEE